MRISKSSMAPLHRKILFTLNMALELKAEVCSRPFFFLANQGGVVVKLKVPSTDSPVE